MNGPRQRGVSSVGTIRSNRLKNCALSSEKELQKRGRGSSDFKYESTHNLIARRWYDNKSVQLLSKYAGKILVWARDGAERTRNLYIYHVQA